MSSERTAMPKDRCKVIVIPGADPVGDWMADVVQSQPDMVLLDTLRDLAGAQETVEKLAPDLILIDIGSGILQRRDLLGRLAAPVSGAAVIVVAMLGEVEMVRQAMLYGAQGFLLKPFSEAELLSSVRQAYDLVIQRRIEVAVKPQLSPGREAEPTARADVVAVFSPKGGVGCTTVAINLAVALRAASKQSTILVDADLRFGDVDAALNITSASSIGSLLPQLDEMDSQFLDRSLLAHSSGIKVVIAPPHLDMADSIRPDDLKRLLTRLSELQEGYLVVDAWSTLDDCTLAVLDLCQHLVVLTTPQVTALRDVHRFLEVLGLLGYDREKILLVLNNCYHRSEVRVADMERALGYPIVQAIEYAPIQVTASLNRGIPLVLEYRDLPAAQSINRLAHMIVERTNQREHLEAEAAPLPEGKERPKRRGLLFQSRPATAGGLRS